MNHHSRTSRLSKQQTELAQQTLDSYDFGNEFKIVQSGTWQIDVDCCSDDWNIILYTDKELPDDEVEKISFHVIFEHGTLNIIDVDAFFLLNGASVGCMP